MFCPSCGVQIQDSVKFCPECGANVKQGSQHSININFSGMFKETDKFKFAQISASIIGVIWSLYLIYAWDSFLTVKAMMNYNPIGVFYKALGSNIALGATEDKLMLQNLIAWALLLFGFCGEKLAHAKESTTREIVTHYVFGIIGYVVLGVIATVLIFLEFYYKVIIL